MNQQKNRATKTICTDYELQGLTGRTAPATVRTWRVEGAGLSRFGFITEDSSKSFDSGLQWGRPLLRDVCKGSRTTAITRAPAPRAQVVGTLFQVMAGSGSPWELQGSCTLVPTSTVWSLGMLLNTGVTGRQGHTAESPGCPGSPQGTGHSRPVGPSPQCHLHRGAGGTKMPLPGSLNLEPRPCGEGRPSSRGSEGPAVLRGLSHKCSPNSHPESGPVRTSRGKAATPGPAKPSEKAQAPALTLRPGSAFQSAALTPAGSALGPRDTRRPGPSVCRAQGPGTLGGHTGHRQRLQDTGRGRRTQHGFSDPEQAALKPPCLQCETGQFTVTSRPVGLSAIIMKK